VLNKRGRDQKRTAKGRINKRQEITNLKSVSGIGF
jgi:hypothetical protein